MLHPRRRWVMYLRLSQDRGRVSYIVLLCPCRITTLNAGIVFELTYIYILHLVIWQTLLSKATYNWGVHKAIHLEEAIRQRKCS